MEGWDYPPNSITWTADLVMVSSLVKVYVSKSIG